ncbi:MAG: hypothetical protein NZ941_03190, partial [Candidatus Caldarchaeum sp.]|nr:hypothetical protein [Candidatus Caldarchaeum sp.]
MRVRAEEFLNLVKLVKSMGISKIVFVEHDGDVGLAVTSSMRAFQLALNIRNASTVSHSEVRIYECWVSDIREFVKELKDFGENMLTISRDEKSNDMVIKVDGLEKRFEIPLCVDVSESPILGWKARTIQFFRAVTMADWFYETFRTLLDDDRAKYLRIRADLKEFRASTLDLESSAVRSSIISRTVFRHY